MLSKVKPEAWESCSVDLVKQCSSWHTDWSNYCAAGNFYVLSYSYCRRHCWQTDTHLHTDKTNTHTDTHTHTHKRANRPPTRPLHQWNAVKCWASQGQDEIEIMFTVHVILSQVQCICLSVWWWPAGSCIITRWMNPWAVCDVSKYVSARTHTHTHTHTQSVAKQ